MQVIQESPILQEVFAERFEQGVQKGAHEARLESLYEILSVRFQVNEAYFEQLNLERLDLETLKKLSEIALTVSDLTAFENAIERLHT
jgi:hypothetical protein